MQLASFNFCVIVFKTQQRKHAQFDMKLQTHIKRNIKHSVLPCALNLGLTNLCTIFQFFPTLGVFWSFWHVSLFTMNKKLMNAIFIFVSSHQYNIAFRFLLKLWEKALSGHNLLVKIPRCYRKKNYLPKYYISKSIPSRYYIYTFC